MTDGEVGLSTFPYKRKYLSNLREVNSVTRGQRDQECVPSGYLCCVSAPACAPSRVLAPVFALPGCLSSSDVTI